MKKCLSIKKGRNIIASKKSFIISIPHIWIHSNNLSKGSKVFFEMDKDLNLIVKAEKEATK